MPVTIYSYSTVQSIPPGGNLTINVSVPSAGMMAVALMGGGNVAHGVPKYNGAGGINMTLVRGIDDAQDEAYIYSYSNPGTGTIPFYFTEVGGQQLIRTQMVLLAGVDLNTPVAGTQIWQNLNTSLIDFTVTHTYKVGQIGLICGGNAYTNGGFTNGTCILLGTSTNSYHGYLPAAEADGTSRFTVNANGNNRYCGVGAIFNPAPVAAGNQVIWM